jgi:fructose-bisphosphate aldolase class II
MPLVTTAELMSHALETDPPYAVGAFNAVNMESAEAIFAAAEAERAPLILQITQTTLDYTAPEPLVACVKELVKRSTVPVAMHLDHGRSYEIVMRFIRLGFSSVMIDGSLDRRGKNPRTLEQNLAVTRKVVEQAHRAGVSVEAEIGRLGQVEDAKGEELLTIPQEAADFVAATGVDTLAVAIGTKHGLFKGKPKIYTDRVAEIREAIKKKTGRDMPLVMHGGTGVPDDDVVNGIDAGIRKINIDTEMRVAFHNACWKIMSDIEAEYKKADAAGDVKRYDIRRILKPCRAAIQEAVTTKMRLFRAAGQAWY